ncbi:small nuclear ribonucleoprotein G-like [Megaptera novaeangliae]
MSKAHPPEWKTFMEKLSLKLNGGRHVQGILWGFDPFMNLVIDECVEMATSGQQNNTGVVVIRGNSTVLGALEPVRTTAVITREINCFHMSPPHFTMTKTGSCTFYY